MPFTLNTPQSQTVTKAAIRITGLDVSFAGADSAAAISYEYVDGSGEPVPGGAGSVQISGSQFAGIWNAGVSLARLYAALETLLGLAAGTAAGDGSLA